MQFKLRDINTAAAGVTQSLFVNNKSGTLQIGNLQQPMVFNSSFMASLTGDYLYKVGDGEINPMEHARLILQYASDRNLPVSVIADEYIDMMRSLGLAQDSFKKIIAGILGVGERPITTNGQPAVTPTYVLSLVKQVVTTQHEVLLHLLADFVCHMISPLGWVLPDTGYVYRIRRTNIFPRYVDLVNAVHTVDLLRVLEQMANANLDLIKATVMSKKSDPACHGGSTSRERGYHCHGSRRWFV
jgi:hypothetical protein